MGRPLMRAAAGADHQVNIRHGGYPGYPWSNKDVSVLAAWRLTMVPNRIFNAVWDVNISAGNVVIDNEDMSLIDQTAVSTLPRT